MQENYPHLLFHRAEPTPERRTRPGRNFFSVDDPASHGRALSESLERAKTSSEENIGGYDERKLLRFEVQKGFDPEQLSKISEDIEFVSQEEDEVVLAFVNETALSAFEAKLSSLSSGEHVTYAQVLYALKGLDTWTPEKRKGWALRHSGFPENAPFFLDIELWPLESNVNQRERLCNSFEGWLTDFEIEQLDKVIQPGLLLYRVRCDLNKANKLLQHRDVRTVDLPPKYGLSMRFLQTDIQEFAQVLPPASDAPQVAVLDTGITAGHPLLQPAVQDARSFLDDADEFDKHGHGTLVAGIALYGDVEAAIQAQRFIPEIRLYSGCILDDAGESSSGLIENNVIAAVRKFHDDFGCKIFNISFGDLNKPYRGSHVRGLALTIDNLSRELGVLFVVSVGNAQDSLKTSSEWRSEYPEYLLEESWRLIDPAPALNAVVVGSIARYDQSFNSQRYTGDPAEIPIARKGQPSPFTRRGPSIGGAIKPDFVAYGGNYAVNTRADYLVRQGLGEISTCKDFSSGRVFSLDCGTSFAAPHITHLAAKLMGEYPSANVEQIRCMLAAQARVPDISQQLFSNPKDVLYVCGYGHVDTTGLFRSSENDVTLMVNDSILDGRHHFYEIYIPDDFTSNGRRMREISVSLAYTPVVRSTRINYRATRMEFRLVSADSLEYVSTMFNRATSNEQYESISELPGRTIGAKARGKGTLQADVWKFQTMNERSLLRRQKLFLVVTRNDYAWGSNLTAAGEKYSVIVNLRDRQNAEARLYTKIQQRLQVGVKERVRV